MWDIQYLKLEEVREAWDNLQAIEHEREVLRQDFVAACAQAVDLNISHKRIAAVCATPQGTISRARITQYIKEVS